MAGEIMLIDPYPRSSVLFQTDLVRSLLKIEKGQKTDKTEMADDTKMTDKTDKMNDMKKKKKALRACILCRKNHVLCDMSKSTLMNNVDI